LAWQDPELIQRANKLIDEIEAGTKYVSMECLFKNFSYAVFNDDGTFNIVPRNEQNAWMTKHLRAYGGTGRYKNMAIKRMFRNITFSGKGYVDRPANPESVIFQSVGTILPIKNENFPSELNLGVSSNMEKEMANEIEDLKTQNIELQAKLDEAIAAQADLQAKLAISEKTSVDLTVQLAEANTKITEEQTKASELEGVKTTLESRVASLENEIKLTKTVAARLSILVDGGIAKDIAQQKIDLFANLNDEQFQDVANELIEAAKCKTKSKVEPKEGEEDEEDFDEKAAETDLEDVKPEADASLITEPESAEENAENDQKLLRGALAKQLGIQV
jgi:hypothetical protein